MARLFCGAVRLDWPLEGSGGGFRPCGKSRLDFPLYLCVLLPLPRPLSTDVNINIKSNVHSKCHINWLLIKIYKTHVFKHVDPISARVPYVPPAKIRPESCRLFCKPGLDGFAPVELRCTDELIGGENRGSSGTVNGALAASSGLGIGVS